MKRILWITSIPAVIILCFVGMNLLGNQKPTHAFPYESLPAIGKPDAPVKVVEFGDYKCPACQHFSTSIFPELEKAYVDTGKVEFHFANYPFLAPDSSRAAEFAQTVYEVLGDDAFWTFNKHLYLAQEDPSREGIDYMNEPFLVGILRDSASVAETQQVVDAFQKGTYTDTIVSQKELGTKTGVNGTPSIFVNGKQVDNGMDLSAVKKAIDKALAHD